MVACEVRDAAWHRASSNNSNNKDSFKQQKDNAEHWAIPSTAQGKHAWATSSNSRSQWWVGDAMVSKECHASTETLTMHVGDGSTCRP